MSGKTITDNHRQRLLELSMFLRELRINSGFNQSEVSSLHRNTLMRIENSHNFNIISLFELADFYDISVSEIFEGIE
jgi:transcriptional regulator with XRE-family HTH domain